MTLSKKGRKARDLVRTDLYLIQHGSFSSREDLFDIGQSPMLLFRGEDDTEDTRAIAEVGRNSGCG